MKGSCLCGAVAYEIEPPFSVFQYCHCSRCRKRGGGSHSANIHVPAGQFRWLAGEEWVARFDLADAKYLAPCFCRRCGSALPWRAKGVANVVVPAGGLDDDPGVRPQQNIFWDSRAPWYVDAAQLPAHAELPPRRKKGGSGGD